MIRRWLRACCWIVLVLSAGLWVVSEIRPCAHYWSIGRPEGFTAVSRGSVALTWYALHANMTISGELGNSWLLTRRVWVPIIKSDTSPFSTSGELTLPLWIPAALSLSGLAVTSSRRSRPDMCAKCGYDTSQSPLPVCPECGDAIGQDADTGATAV